MGSKPFSRGKVLSLASVSRNGAILYVLRDTAGLNPDHDLSYRQGKAASNCLPLHNNTAPLDSCCQVKNQHLPQVAFSTARCAQQSVLATYERVLFWFRKGRLCASWQPFTVTVKNKSFLQARVRIRRLTRTRMLLYALLTASEISTVTLCTRPRLRKAAEATQAAG